MSICTPDSISQGLITDIGQALPDCGPLETTAGPIKLKQFLGRQLILYFYPRDNTPGCTQESEDFRDQYQSFLDQNCTILGVSRDSLKSHHKFKEKLNLPFELISDPEESFCNLFGVMKMKNMYGKKVRGIERSTFIFNTTGSLCYQWRKVKVPGHVATVLETLRKG